MHPIGIYSISTDDDYKTTPQWLPIIIVHSDQMVLLRGIRAGIQTTTHSLVPTVLIRSLSVTISRPTFNDANRNSNSVMHYTPRHIKSVITYVLYNVYFDSVCHVTIIKLIVE